MDLQWSLQWFVNCYVFTITYIEYNLWQRLMLISLQFGPNGQRLRGFEPCWMHCANPSSSLVWGAYNTHTHTQIPAMSQYLLQLTLFVVIPLWKLPLYWNTRALSFFPYLIRKKYYQIYKFAGKLSFIWCIYI